MGQIRQVCKAWLLVDIQIKNKLLPNSAHSQKEEYWHGWHICMRVGLSVTPRLNLSCFPGLISYAGVVLMSSTELLSGFAQRFFNMSNWAPDRLMLKKSLYLAKTQENMT